MESRKWSLFKARWSHVEQLGRRLYQAPLLAFHTATWDASPAVQAHISARATIYWRQISESGAARSQRLSAWNQSAEMRLSINTINFPSVCFNIEEPDRNNRHLSTTQTQTEERETKIPPLTLHDVSFVVAVIVAVGGPVVNVESLNRGVVVTRGTILDGGTDRERLC